jgi:hypothetical protein
VLIQGDQTRAATCCWCGGGTGKGMKKGEHRSTPVQQARRATADAPAGVAEDVSLATSRWCWSRDYRRRATSGCPFYCCHCCYRSRCSCLFPHSYPCLCHCCWGWGKEGERPPEDTVVFAVVGVEAAAAMEGTLLLRVRSRMRRPVTGPPSGPGRSPQVQGHCEWYGRRGTTTTA